MLILVEGLKQAKSNLTAASTKLASAEAELARVAGIFDDVGGNITEGK